MESIYKNPRLEKLRALVENHGGHRELCRAFPDLNVDYIGQLLNGTRNFGERAARKMALQIGKPADYFDATPGISDAQKLLLDATADLTSKQITRLIQAADWLQEGRTISASDPPPQSEAGGRERKSGSKT
jgi:hypothetical protein